MMHNDVNDQENRLPSLPIALPLFNRIKIQHFLFTFGDNDDDDEGDSSHNSIIEAKLNRFSPPNVYCTANHL